MAKAQSTPHCANAATYREAARIVEQENCQFTCWAIAIAGDFENAWDHKQYNPPILTEYVATFSDGDHNHLQSLFEEEDGIERRNLRVLALCFMAAITERP